jgi:hypothetical protein
MNLLEKIIKKLPPAACGRLGVALRATWGGLATPWRPRPEQILRPSNNKSHTPTPNFTEIQDQRRKKKKERRFFLKL